LKTSCHGKDWWAISVKKAKTSIHWCHHWADASEVLMDEIGRQRLQKNFCWYTAAKIYSQNNAVKEEHKTQ
jgi:hypothetical protein